MTRMIDQELLELLESTVTIASKSGQKGLDGKQGFGTPVPYQAHISNRRVMVRNAAGEEVMSDGSADLDGAYPISESDRITLPDGRQPSIVSIGTSYDSAGPYQTTVYW